jgi:heme-degrading monooxygenase HmoA
MERFDIPYGNEESRFPVPVRPQCFREVRLLLRVYQADVRIGQEAALFARLADVLAEEGPTVRGLDSVRIGRQMSDGGEKVVIVTIWQDLASLQREVGQDWLKARFLPGDLAEMIENPVVWHYEVVAEYPAVGDSAADRPA